MSRRVRNLAFSAIAGILIAALASSLLKGDAPAQVITDPGIGQQASEPVPPTPPAGSSTLDGRSDAPSATGAPADHAELMRYAVALEELHGLPRDVPSGTRLEIWAAFDPPMSRKATVQRLIRGVVLDRIVPAVTPNGPDAVLLAVAEDRLSDLIFADRYGALAVAVLPDEEPQ